MRAMVVSGSRRLSLRKREIVATETRADLAISDNRAACLAICNRFTPRNSEYRRAIGLQVDNLSRAAAG